MLIESTDQAVGLAPGHAPATLFDIIQSEVHYFGIIQLCFVINDEDTQAAAHALDLNVSRRPLCRRTCHRT